MDNQEYIEKIEQLAKLIEYQQIERLKKEKLGCPGNLHNCKVYIRPGKKYTKIDVGYSGKYMIDDAGIIYGIKSYGVIHRGHIYGTLDTVIDFYWGGYRAIKKED